MQAARVFGTLFLAMTLVFGTVVAFIPLGDAAFEKDGARTTDTFSMFGKAREISPAGEAADGNGATRINWADVSLDATGGITYLRLMGPALVGGLVLVFAALLLTAIPKTSDSVIGGFVALPGALLILTSVTTVVLGSYMHSYHLLGPGSQVDWNGVASTIAVLAVLGSTIAAGMGLVSVRRQATEAWGTQAAHPSHAGWVAGRNLRCPECSTVVTAGYGVVPICPSCDFGADYNGPAAPPVPVRALSG